METRPTARPTLRARLLGHELRRVREASGLTIAELATRSGQSPHRIRLLEDGATGSPSPEPTLWRSWGVQATSVINALCRLADRVDVFAPLGIHPDLRHLDPDRCTAYVLEGTPVDRADVVVRRIPHSTYPGVENPLTRFRLPDGPDVVFYPYLHAAQFTEDQRHLDAADALFDRLPGLTTPAGRG